MRPRLDTIVARKGCKESSLRSAIQAILIQFELAERTEYNIIEVVLYASTIW